MQPGKQTMSVRRRTVTCPEGPMQARDSLHAGSSAPPGQFTVPSIASPAADAACGVRRGTKWGAMRLKTIGRRTGRERSAILGY